ncbi:MAG: hypothetical protein HY815_17230 [Candidatus Riflebacteria bacterium]|nr:hypothetical protein [Candidatus Riflebacteria bacterium]
MESIPSQVDFGPTARPLPGFGVLVVRLPAGTWMGAEFDEDHQAPGGFLILLQRPPRSAQESPVHSYRLFRLPARVGPVPIRIVARTDQGRIAALDG